MDRLQAMQVFVKVADGGGFAEAARQLNMSASVVTRAIASLEEAIGTRLLTRTTRSVKLTESGGRYLEDCRRILADIQETEAAAAGSYATPTGTLTVTASVLFGQIYVLPILTEYLRTLSECGWAGAVPRPHHEHRRRRDRCRDPHRAPDGFKLQRDPRRFRPPGHLRRTGLFQKPWRAGCSG